MPARLVVDDSLIEEGRKLSRRSTRKETVNAALSEYIQRRKQIRSLTLYPTEQQAQP